MKDCYMEFRRARREEAEEILQLYRSLIGTEYCVWTENYPTEREVEFDLSRNALFCLYERMPEPDEREQGARLSEEQTAGHLPVTRGRLMGVISMDDDPEVGGTVLLVRGSYPGGRAVQTGSGSRISESRHCQDPVAGSYGGIEITGL
ncbi:MAG: hypothetical protein ACLVGL_17830 [Waltera sp.]